MVNLLSEEEIFLRLSVIVREALRVDPAKITPDASLIDDLDAESLDIVDIRFRVDDAFGIKSNLDELIRSLGSGLTVGEIRERLTVSALARYVEKCLRTKPGSP